MSWTEKEALLPQSWPGIECKVIQGHNFRRGQFQKETHLWVIKRHHTSGIGGLSVLVLKEIYHRSTHLKTFKSFLLEKCSTWPIKFLKRKKNPSFNLWVTLFFFHYHLRGLKFLPYSTDTREKEREKQKNEKKRKRKAKEWHTRKNFQLKQLELNSRLIYFPGAFHWSNVTKIISKPTCPH